MSKPNLIEELKKLEADIRACRDAAYDASGPAWQHATKAMIRVEYILEHVETLALRLQADHAVEILDTADRDTQRVPEGFVLVPSQPDGAMWEAGREADVHPGDSYTAVYCAMIAAAPPG